VLYTAPPQLCAAFLLASTSAIFAVYGVFVSFVCICTPEHKRPLYAVYGRLWRMGENTYILPIFTMVKYGFYFWLKNGCDFGVFFSTSHGGETGFPQKS
jgi:hypothetical protein